ncbi:MAG: hypothetical protein V1744_07310 [Candidatus Altiarchaeota archaeon]
MKFLKDSVIKVDRELSDLDRFTLDFIKILRKHTTYVIVSGYVSILLGRARSSEDVDIIVPRMDYASFSKLADDIKGGGFWCLQAERNRSIYEYFQDRIAVRFAKKDAVIPNIELKCAKNRADEIALDEAMTVKLDGDELTISNLELQVAFKEAVLKSPKDMEDAKHIRNIMGAKLDKDRVRGYRRILHGIYRG